MPVTRTAKRAFQKSKYKEQRNKVVRSKIKDVVKDAKKISVGKKEIDKKELTIKIAKTLDKAAKRNVIHKNKAARLKSRLTKKLNAAEAKPKEVVVKKKPTAKKTTSKKKTSTKKK